MKNEIKDTWIKARISTSFKETIEEYCAGNGLTVSELIRQAIWEKVSKLPEEEQDAAIKKEIEVIASIPYR